MSVTAIHLLNKEVFEPIVRPLENVAIADGIDESSWVYGRVLFIEPIQPFVIDLGSISASTPTMHPQSGSSVKLDQLSLGDREFGQWRLLVMDDYLLRVNLPAAITRFITKGGATTMSKLTLKRDQMAEVYTRGDKVPTVTPYNPNFYPIDMARLLVAGFRYVIAPVTEKPKEYTVIPVSGVPAVGKR